MSPERNISESDILAALTDGGLTLDDYFLIDGKMPGFVNERGVEMILVIEDDLLAEACIQFLQRRGARVVPVGRGS
jgi:hypothetical protein